MLSPCLESAVELLAPLEQEMQPWGRFNLRAQGRQRHSGALSLISWLQFQTNLLYPLLERDFGNQEEILESQVSSLWLHHLEFKKIAVRF